MDHGERAEQRGPGVEPLVGSLGLGFVPLKLNAFCPFSYKKAKR